MIGLVVGCVWEAYRWLEPVGLSSAATRSATELVAHVLAGVVGGLVAGVLLAAVRRPGGVGADGDEVRVPAGSSPGSIL
jgi:hypothetical protein